jgi:hypothetical protein
MESFDSDVPIWQCPRDDAELKQVLETFAETYGIRTE